ncbi:GPP34 family phosphoprotein [Streptomyces sp. NBC_00887]|uniref:GPP34 family phosphoprotein n=1 Tax=Streptomyces sp. NBC_00887 TaxID=2975859 RepID=UPI00386F7E76|nr:GPP34 family phosphoprotein [Streptomyces sp. NBC_00887]WSY36214.1 GPP34 family phosphoprotein [Streptomyces sp. NBC_00887]
MTTPQNLLMITMDETSTRRVDPADLSVALAGAELIDLLEAKAIGLDNGYLVPGRQAVPDDHCLQQAMESLHLTEPYQLVSDWLGNREDMLVERYTAALETEDLATRRRPRGHPLRSREVVLVDSPAHRQALERWASAEPVLVALAASVGIRTEQPHRSAAETDEAVAAVLSAVEEALAGLAAEREESIITQAKLDGLWDSYVG